MYHFEVFALKDNPLPELLRLFEQTHETRFHVVFEKAIPDGECYRWESLLQDLQNKQEISYFYWVFIPIAK